MAPFILGLVFLVMGIDQDNILDMEQSKKLFQQVFDAAPFPCLVFNEDGIVDCNSAAVAILNAKNKQDVLSKYPALFSPETQPDGTSSLIKSIEMDRLARENEFHRFEWMHRTLDGDDLPVEVSLKQIKIQKRKVLLVQWKDLREEKKSRLSLETALNQAEFYRSALDQTAIVAVTDAKGKITYANQKFTEISGYSNAELLGKDHRILNSGYHPKSFFKDLWTTISNGKIWRGEICNHAKDGHSYWVDTTIIPRFDSQRKISQHTVIRFEITERKKAEERLDLSLENAKMAVWYQDLKTNKIWRSNRHDLLYGYGESLPVWNAEIFYSHIHEDDRVRVREELEASLQKPRSVIRFRIRLHESRAMRWVEIVTKIIKSNEGVSVRRIGTTQDITERMVLEQSLILSRKMTEELNQKNKLLLDVAAIANQASSIKDTIQLTLNSICLNLGLSVGHAYIVSESEPDLLVSSKTWFMNDGERFSSFKEVSEKIKFKKGEGLPGAVLESRESI